MGALPKKKLSSSRRGKRYATKKYSVPTLMACQNCGKLKQGHTICPHCGQYRGRTVLEQKEAVKVTKVKPEETE